jgi:hypothetical protein
VHSGSTLAGATRLVTGASGTAPDGSVSLLGEFFIIASTFALGQVLVFFNTNRKIRKHMDTAVAFTQEYPRYRFLQGMQSVLIKDQGCPRIKIDKCLCV